MKGYSCLVAVLLLAGANCAPSYVKCPETDPLNRAVFYPHETNCGEFYVCDHGLSVKETCPAGLHWNSRKNVCDWPSEAGCIIAIDGGVEGNSNVGDSGTGKEVGGEKNVCGSGGDGSVSNVCPAGIAPACPDAKSQSTAYLAHPSDCQWFYLCSNGVPACKQCPGGLHWNAKVESCDWPWNAGCLGGSGGDSKTPGNGGENPGNGDITPGNGGENPDNGGNTPVVGKCKLSRLGYTACPVPQTYSSVYFSHPTDCTKFFECSNGVAIEQWCAPGLYFNPDLDVCDYPQNVPCCYGAGGDNTPSNPDNPNPSGGDNTPSNPDNPNPSGGDNTPSNPDDPNPSGGDNTPSNPDEPNPSGGDNTPSNPNDPNPSGGDNTPSNPDDPSPSGGDAGGDDSGGSSADGVSSESASSSEEGASSGEEGSSSEQDEE